MPSVAVLSLVIVRNGNLNLQNTSQMWDIVGIDPLNRKSLVMKKSKKGVKTPKFELETIKKRLMKAKELSKED